MVSVLEGQDNVLIESDSVYEIQTGLYGSCKTMNMTNLRRAHHHFANILLDSIRSDVSVGSLI